MSVFDSFPTTPVVVRADAPVLDEAQVAAGGVLGPLPGSHRGLVPCRSAPVLPVGGHRRGAAAAGFSSHIELYRACLDDRGLAATTVDRRLSTVCGYYRFAHMDGRISSNPAQYVRRPRVNPSAQPGMDRGELAAFLYTAERTSPTHAALAVLLGLNGLRVSEACGGDVEDLRVRTLTPNAADRRQRQQASHHPAGAPHYPHPRPGYRRADRRPDPAAPRWVSARSTHRPSLGPVDRQTGRTRTRPSTHAPRRVHHGRPRRRCTATRRPTRRLSRRPEDHHGLRPPTPELRPSRRLRQPRRPARQAAQDGERPLDRLDRGHAALSVPRCGTVPPPSSVCVTAYAVERVSGDTKIRSQLDTGGRSSGTPRRGPDPPTPTG
jgi:hypothetical protein